MDQLRRFLDDQAWLENKRIMDVIKEIEKNAVALKSAPPKDNFTGLDAVKLSLDLPMDRTLFTPPRQTRLDEAILIEGASDITADPLFDQVYVDEEQLAANIRKALQIAPQISLKSANFSAGGCAVGLNTSFFIDP